MVPVVGIKVYGSDSKVVESCTHKEIYTQNTRHSTPGGWRNTRLEEVVLARIRLGHTYLTHSYLLKQEDQPECVGCACPLTDQHIMIDCVEFAYIRNRFFRCQRHERSLRFSYTFNNPIVC